MSLERARNLQRRLGWVDRVRPMVVGAFLADLLAPERRTIIENASGLRYFVDPLSNLGRTLVLDSRMEAETEQILREYLFAGASFLDVGANEGYFTAMGAMIVGPTGYVAAVEPQSRLCEIIEINLGLNGVRGNIFKGALGGSKGEQAELHLSPALNTGASSLTMRISFSHRSETVNFVDPELLLSGRSEFALVKVDVEGFEDKVVQSLLLLLQRGQIRVLLLDYHESILQAKGVAPQTIEDALLGAGMVLQSKPEGFNGYRLYRKP